MLGSPGGPTLEEPDVIPRVDFAAVGIPLANPTKEGSPLQSKRHDLASPA